MPAELVAYSGFSPTNYIQEPYSPDLDFGTGEWSVGSWVNVPTVLPKENFTLVGTATVANDIGTAPWGTPSSGTVTGGVWSGMSQYATILLSTAFSNSKVYRLRATATVNSGSFSWVIVGGSVIVNASGTVDVFFTPTYGQVSLYCGIAGSITVTSFELQEVVGVSIIDRSYSTGPKLNLSLRGTGTLLATAYDGTTTLTTTTTTAYNIGTWLKASAHYQAGRLSINVNGKEVAATSGAPLKSLSSRYNLLNYSEQFDNAAWAWGSAIETTVVSNTALDPDGLMLADRITFTAQYKNRKQNIATTVGKTYTFSMWIKRETGNSNLTLLLETTSNQYGGIDITDQWVRYSVTFVANATSTAVGIQDRNISGWGSILVAKAQLEEGSILTDHQRTTTVAETGPLAPLTIGNSYTLDAPFPGSLALLKLSATVPTPEQSEWMYNQEKAMFQPDAKCCLPDSGALLDIAYDDSSDSWVTTSATNESTWAGLVRTNVTPVSAGSYTKVSATSGVKLQARSTTTPGVDVTVPDYNLRTKALGRRKSSSKAPATFDYVGGFTATTTTGSSVITSAAGLSYPTSYVGAVITGTGIAAGTYVTAVSGTTIYLSAAATASGTAVQISFTDFILPAGMEAKLVMSGGTLKQEGSTKDWTRLYDGFREIVRFAVAPGYTAWVQIQATKAD